MFALNRYKSARAPTLSSISLWNSTVSTILSSDDCCTDGVELVDGCVASEELVDGCVAAEELVDGRVAADELVDGCVAATCERRTLDP